MPTVLIVASEETFPLVALVAQVGYGVIEASDSGEALQQVLRRSPDAVILRDDAEPVEGVELLPVLRQMTSAVIIVVGEGGENRMAQALFQGADAYWKLPVDAGKLSSRLRSLLRRLRERRRTDGHGRIHSMSQEKPLQPYLSTLSPVEARLLSSLLERGGAMAPTDQLVADVWGEGDRRASLRFYIRRLRAKLEPSGFFRILNRKGIGYRLELRSDGLEQG